MPEKVSLKHLVQNLDKHVKAVRSRQDTKQIEVEQRFNQVTPFKILIDLISGIAVGGFLGYSLDSYFGTIPLILFIFIVFGMIGGIYNNYKSLVLEEKHKEEGKK